MSKTQKKGLAPELRFPEFKENGEWLATEVNDVIKQHVEKTTQNKQYPVLTSSRQGIFFQNEYYKQDVASADTTGYNVVPRGYFTYRHMSDDLVFRFNINDICEKGIVSTLYPVFKTLKGVNPNFLRELLNEGQEFKQYAQAQKQGGSRTYMYLKKLQKLIIHLPATKEQQKIADCLSSIDDLIAAHSKKLDALKDHKKWLMQNLFPAEGEKESKLRFPEFYGSGAWKYTTLNKVAKRSKAKNSEGIVNEVLTNSAEFGVISQRDFFDKDIANKSNLGGYYIVDEGDYVYNPRISSHAPVGPISKNRLQIGIMSPLYTVFKFDSSENEFYEVYFKSNSWHSYMRSVSSTGARHDRMSISVADFMNMPIPCPEVNEQKKIIEAISSVEALVRSQVKKVELLKSHKKSLIQKLFPTSNEVGV